MLFRSPWNRFSQPHTTPDLNPLPILLNITANEWEEMTEDVFNKSFANSPLKRTKYKGIQRNLQLLRQTENPSR